MEIKKSIALVTGANRGLGQAYAQALLEAGAAKVYAASRDPSAITDPRLIPVRLDITNAAQVTAASVACRDVNLLINNAGIMRSTPLLAEGGEAALRDELEVNVLGLRAMIRAFAPVLAANGGGAMANMLSVVSWYVYPFNATYCASKAAALAVTEAARTELHRQGTLVVDVYAGFLDTDMAANVSGTKTPPRQVAERTLEGIRQGQHHVYADDHAVQLRHLVLTDPEGLAERMREAWEQGQGWRA